MGAAHDLDEPFVDNDDVIEVEAELYEIEALEEFELAPEPTLEEPNPRVKYLAAATVKCEGLSESLEAVVLNLSTKGLALTTDTELRRGQRVWVNFSLDLASEPLILLCEVLWARFPTSGQPVYGLRFAGLTRDESLQVRAAVTERHEGRAAQWTLPVFPDVPNAQVQSRTSTPATLAALAGLACGVGLTLGIGASYGAFLTEHPTQVREEFAAAESKFDDSGTQVSPAASEIEKVETPTPTLTAQGNDEPAAKPVEEEAPPPSALATKPEPHVSGLQPVSTDNGVKLSLLTDGPVADHVSFWLENPKRFVVDVLGRRSGFDQPRYAVSHPLVRKVRIGNYDNKVRFVLEVADETGAHATTSLEGQSVAVEFKRQ